ncbi:hypothetical protein [Marinobacter salsuginis]|uniref:hypothetical protein n=1 Tax=Marinobacter salsuginis TaxID=418719 RepID=UPI001298FF33|nr:hypothetical protein [Marinobacter salsuginis]
MASNDKRRLVLVDTHVHYHSFCSVTEFFDCAWENLWNAAASFDESANFIGILCLLETRGSSRFGEIRDAAQGKSAFGKWRIDTIFDGRFLAAEGEGGAKVYVVPGSQIVTKENLEVLIIGPSDDVPHEQPLTFYLQQYSSSHLVIIPWGFGKWLGKRGLVLKQAMYQLAQLEYVLGDSSGRPNCWQRIAQFEDAKRLGKHILSGSDPLPVAGQQRKVGIYGAAFYSDQRAEGLVRNLRETILGLPLDEVRPFGHSDGLFDFIFSQFLLRLNRIK